MSGDRNHRGVHVVGPIVYLGPAVGDRYNAIYIKDLIEEGLIWGFGLGEGYYEGVKALDLSAETIGVLAIGRLVAGEDQHGKTYQKIKPLIAYVGVKISDALTVAKIVSMQAETSLIVYKHQE